MEVGLITNWQQRILNTNQYGIMLDNVLMTSAQSQIKWKSQPES